MIYSGFRKLKLIGLTQTIMYFQFSYHCVMSRLIHSQSRADDLGLLDVMLFYWYMMMCITSSLWPVISTVWHDELSAVWQLDMSAVWQLDMSAVWQLDMSAMWQLDMSAVWQLDMSAMWQWGCLWLVCLSTQLCDSLICQLCDSEVVCD